MGVLPPDELVRLWVAEQLPPERAIGQLVQHLARLQRALDTQRQMLAQIQADLARAQGTPPAPPKGSTHKH
jgi:hypothetical protein